MSCADKAAIRIRMNFRDRIFTARFSVEERELSLREDFFDNVV